MFEKVLSKEAKNLLALLGKESFFKDFYLAGGTALALRLGHRLSFDFDFYSPKKFTEKAVLLKLKEIGDFKETQIDWQTITGHFPDLKFSLFYYQYPLVGKTDHYLGIKIASLSDLAAMKIGAISSRGTKRDFIDLYFLSQKSFPLEKMLRFYDKKYGNLKDLGLHIIKSLQYFKDAEDDQMPQMLMVCDWAKVKRFFLKEAPRVLDKLIK